MNNIVSWTLQVSILTFFGALLPMVFAIRHPRSHLTYCYIVLAGCLLLPFVQGRQHPVVSQPVMAQATSATTVTISQLQHPASTAKPLPWPSFFIAIVAAGILVRLSWLMIGLWRLK